MKWYRKRRNTTTKGKLDVCIKVIASGSTQITFRFGCVKKIIGNSRYIVFGLDDGNKLRFKEADEKEGWIVTIAANPEYSYFGVMNDDLRKWAMLNGGEHVLMNDEDGYYIQGVNEVGTEE